MSPARRLRWRLAQRVLWWRAAWPFRWAHKPLCGRFTRDVLRIGRLHLCRGCVAFHAGALAAFTGLALSTPGPVALGAVFLGLTLVVAVASRPGLHGRLPRPVRDATRMAAGVCIVVALAYLPLGHPGIAVVCLLALLVVRQVHVRRRAPLRARMCDGCPELGAAAVCSGYRAAADATQRYERELERRLELQLLSDGRLPAGIDPRR